MQSFINNYSILSQNLSSKRVTLGFDGFIDSIVKVIMEKNENSEDLYFKTSHDFARYILEKKSKNFSIELEELTCKLGGNMPIMANALALLGPELACIGTLGFPKIHPAFLDMPGKCTLYSVAESGSSTALEFENNKIMMAKLTSINHVNWQTIKDILGVEKVIELFSDRHLICLLNWSELENSTDIWKGLLRNILPNVPAMNTKPIGFFDLSDCSQKAPAKIREALGLLNEFSCFWDVTLSLNLNETNIVYNALLKGDKTETPVNEMGEAIYHLLKITNLLIHYSSEAMCWNKTGRSHRRSLGVAQPKLLTGAGDNFNAGFCAGLLLGISIDECLEIGHAVSGYYLRQGESPTLDQIISNTFQEATQAKYRG